LAGGAFSHVHRQDLASPRANLRKDLYSANGPLGLNSFSKAGMVPIVASPVAKETSLDDLTVAMR